MHRQGISLTPIKLVTSSLSRCERCEAESGLGPITRRFQLSANSLTARLGPKVSAAVAAADSDTLTAAAVKLSRSVQEVEQQVNLPNITPRVGGWAHGSVYQVRITGRVGLRFELSGP